MKRRAFFKLLGSAGVSIALAPLAKFIPAAQNKAAMAKAYGSKPELIGSNIRLRIPQRYVMQRHEWYANTPAELL